MRCAEGRRTDRAAIFIDWLRNQRGSTAILPYSARARPGAPVAVPIDWSELEGMKNAHPFSIDDVDALLKRAAQLKGWGFAAQSLPEI
jgi:bifunctional non-homologous end joining protein LigD